MATDEGLDDVLAAIGYGVWQLPVLILTILVHVIIPIHLVGSSLLSAPVDFRCSTSSSFVHDTNNGTILSLPRILENLTAIISDQSRTSSPYDNQCLGANHSSFLVGLPNKSGSYSNATGHPTGLPSCPWVDYDTSVFTSTVISEWDLICEKETLRPLFQMMYSIGALFGSAIGGQISDNFGRKRAVQIASMINLSAVLCMYSAPWYSGILVARIFIGGTCNFMVLPAYSLALEITPPKHRTIVGMLLGTSFSVGIIIFAGLGYFIRTWRYLMLITASLPLLLIIPMSFWVKESPRWLIQHQGGNEASQMMTKAVSVNKVTLSQSLASTIEGFREKPITSPSENDQNHQRGNIWARFRSSIHGACVYFRSAPLRVILIVTPMIWILHGCLYLGIILNANNFTSNNPFVYVTVSGVMDLTSILLATPLSIRLGRRILISGPFFLGGIFLMLDVVIPQYYLWLKWMLVMTALMLAAASYQVNFLYTPELYPTVIRARGFAFACLAGNIGFLIAPLITDLLSQYAWWAVNVTVGGAGIVGSLLVPLLPETNNRPLPETILDVEKRHINNQLQKKREKKKKSTKYSSEENCEEPVEEGVALAPS